METDQGPCALGRCHEGLIPGISRRQLPLRHRKGLPRRFRSPRRLLDDLHGQHDEASALNCLRDEAMVPQSTASFAPMQELNRPLFSRVKAEEGLRKATFDIHATILPSYMSDAFATYRSANGRRPERCEYQPLNCFLSEPGRMPYPEMRDGSSPAREEDACVLSHTLEKLPNAVT